MSPRASILLLSLAVAGGCFAGSAVSEGDQCLAFIETTRLAPSAGSTGTELLIGSLLGLAAGVGVTALTYLGLVSIPQRRLFAVTTALISLLAAGLAAQAVLFLQQAGGSKAGREPVRISAPPGRLTPLILDCAVSGTNSVSFGAAAAAYHADFHFEARTSTRDHVTPSPRQESSTLFSTGCKTTVMILSLETSSLSMPS